MVMPDPARREVDDLLDEAGAHWRARQDFGVVPLAPRTARPYGRVASGLLIPAVGLAAAVAVAGAVIAFGPLKFSGAGAEASSHEPGTSQPMASAGALPLSPLELELRGCGWSKR